MSTGRSSGFLQFLLSLAPREKIKLIFSLLGLTSPFFPWFHSCNNIPGNYECVTWQGFQYDNDIYGLFVFLLSAAALLLVIYPFFSAEWKPMVSRIHLSTASGAGIAILAILRLITFQGTSSATTLIGPSMGLLFVFASGAGIVICDNTGIFQKIAGLIVSTRERTANHVKADEPADLPDYDDQELIDLMDGGSSGDPSVTATEQSEISDFEQNKEQQRFTLE